MSPAKPLPDYASRLAAYHRGYAHELRAMIASLPLAEGDRVLDFACGDGAYSGWLTERVGDSGGVVAADISVAFLNQAREQGGDRVGFVAASLQNMPFGEGTFDLVWCAQSLYSLPNPKTALVAMARLLRPGGTLAVLEDDSLHHILLPWPIDVELAVRAAELRAFREQSQRPGKFYVGRELTTLFRSAGLVDCRKRTWATDRQAPLEPDVRSFLELDLTDLRERVRPYLDVTLLAHFDQVTDPSSVEFLLDGPDLAVTCLDHLVWARKPSA